MKRSDEMDVSVGSTIEKIKLQEHDIENKLKKKRQQEAELSSLNRAIKESILQTAKFDQERLEISERIKKLRPLLEIEKMRRDALLAQLESDTKMFEDLKTQSNRGITKVWSFRSSLCETVQRVSDSCDLWALMMRSAYTDSVSQLQTQALNINNVNDEDLINNESRLKAALQRRKDVETKREKLLNEPDTGEEFIRIKNALSYSLQKITDLQN